MGDVDAKYASRPASATIVRASAIRVGDQGGEQFGETGVTLTARCHTDPQQDGDFLVGQLAGELPQNLPLAGLDNPPSDRFC